MHRADSSDDDMALGADVGESLDGFPLGEREGVASGFVGDSEIGAGGFPFAAVGGDTSSAVAFACDEVGEFVEDDTDDLVL